MDFWAVFGLMMETHERVLPWILQENAQLPSTGQLAFVSLINLDHVPVKSHVKTIVQIYFKTLTKPCTWFFSLFCKLREALLSFFSFSLLTIVCVFVRFIVCSTLISQNKKAVSQKPLLEHCRPKPLNQCVCIWRFHKNNIPHLRRDELKNAIFHH